MLNLLMKKKQKGYQDEDSKMLDKWKTVLTQTKIKKDVNVDNFTPKYMPKSPIKQRRINRQ